MVYYCSPAQPAGCADHRGIQHRTPMPAHSLPDSEALDDQQIENEPSETPPSTVASR
jgi:hypothetical protein